MPRGSLPEKRNHGLCDCVERYDSRVPHCVVEQRIVDVDSEMTLQEPRPTAVAPVYQFRCLALIDAMKLHHPLQPHFF